MRSDSSDSEEDIILPSSLQDDFSDNEDGAGEELFHTVSSDDEGEKQNKLKIGTEYVRTIHPLQIQKGSVYETDEVTAELLVTLDDYIQRKQDIACQLSSAFFQLALARKSRTGIVAKSVDDLRNEFEATAFVTIEDTTTNDSLTESNSVTLFKLHNLPIQNDTVNESKSQKDPIYLLSGLPPPALKKAQQEFRKALQLLITLPKDLIYLEDIFAHINDSYTPK